MQYKVLIFQQNNAADLEDYLRARNFALITASSQDILEKIEQKDFDIAVLDSFTDCENLQDSPYTLVKKLRQINPRMGIVFIPNALKTTETDALRAGADLYISKPYSFDSVAERLLALLRRTGPLALPDTIKIGAYTFNVQESELTIGDLKVKLPTKDAALLKLLCEYEGQLLPKSLILRTIWVEDNLFNARSMDVHITHLRNYLKHDPRIKIQNV